MTSWFLECQIEGLRGKMASIVADWKSLERSISDEENDDFNSMMDALLRASYIIERRAYKLTHEENTEDQNEK